MNSRERANAALEHRQPDRVAVDIGGAVVTVHSNCRKLTRKLSSRCAGSLSGFPEPVGAVLPHRHLFH